MIIRLAGNEVGRDGVDMENAVLRQRDEAAPDKDVTICFKVPPTLLRELDAFRRAIDPCFTRSAAVRRLIRIALQHQATNEGDRR